MIDQILIYRFVYIFTSTDEEKHFSWLHFVVPVGLWTAFSVVAETIIPHEHKLEVVYSGEGDSPYAILYALASIVAVVNHILYPTLGIVRILRYKRRIGDYYADVQTASLNWLVTVLILTLMTAPFPLTGLFMQVNILWNSWFSIQGTLPFFFVYPVLCYNLLSNNFVIIASDNKNPTGNSVIDQIRFEQYLYDKKPFLNPRLRVMDVAYDLCTNRNYISTFINNTYGMNFNHLINSLRLKELDRLRLSPEHKDDTNMDLVLAAGFSCYRSYLRAKQAEYDISVLKIF